MIELVECLHFDGKKMVTDPWFDGINETCTAFTHIHLITSEIGKDNDLIRCRAYIGKTMIDEQLYLGNWNDGKWPMTHVKSVAKI